MKNTVSFYWLYNFLILSIMEYSWILVIIVHLLIVEIFHTPKREKYYTPKFNDYQHLANLVSSILCPSPPQSILKQIPALYHFISDWNTYYVLVPIMPQALCLSFLVLKIN